MSQQISPHKINYYSKTIPFMNINDADKTISLCIIYI